MSRRLKSIAERWKSQRPRRHSGESDAHPGLWLALAVLCALVGALVTLSLDASSDAALAIATDAPAIADSLLGDAP